MYDPGPTTDPWKYGNNGYFCRRRGFYCNTLYSVKITQIHCGGKSLYKAHELKTDQFEAVESDGTLEMMIFKFLFCFFGLFSKRKKKETEDRDML